MGGCARGRVSSRLGVVSQDAHAGVEKPREGAEVRVNPEISAVGEIGVGLYDDLVTLPNAEGDHVGFVGLDGHQVSGDDGKFMPIDPEGLRQQGTGVDDANLVLGAFFDDGRG